MSDDTYLLVERWEAVKSQITQLQDAATALEAAIAARIAEGPVKDPTGKTVAVVKPPGLRFNRKRALEELDEDDLRDYQDFSAAKLKDRDPDLYESFRDPSGTARIEIVE